VVASAPTAAAALCMAAASDLLVAVPAHGCAALAGSLGLVTRPMPVPVSRLPVVASWHGRYEGDRAHAWLREVVAGAAAGMLAAA
ncbi:LysR family transcriptional regulator, partial [Burkholderia sp. Ac-20379]|nr:LysR family transcriptional regulator [Burkholderia sp. Ac-20379]